MLKCKVHQINGRVTKKDLPNPQDRKEFCRVIKKEFGLEGQTREQIERSFYAKGYSHITGLSGMNFFGNLQAARRFEEQRLKNKTNSRERQTPFFVQLGRRIAANARCFGSFSTA